MRGKSQDSFAIYPYSYLDMRLGELPGIMLCVFRMSSAAMDSSMDVLMEETVVSRAVLSLPVVSKVPLSAYYSFSNCKMRCRSSSIACHATLAP